MPSLKELRGDRTQADFASRLGISQAAYQKMESGVYPNRLQAETVRRMADGAGISYAELCQYLPPEIRPAAPDNGQPTERRSVPETRSRRGRRKKSTAPEPPAISADGLLGALAETIEGRIFDRLVERVADRVLAKLETLVFRAAGR